MHPDPATAASAALDAAHLRHTKAALAMAELFAFRGGDWLSHAEVESVLQATDAAPNRVTLYRLLDRFVAAGLLRRSVDAQRRSRFAWAAGQPAGAPHFECDSCHQPVPLPGGAAAEAAAAQLLAALQAAGLQATAVDVAVRGRCADCGDDAATGSAAA